MTSVVDYINGKPQIKRPDTFCSILGGALPDDSSTFHGMLDHIDEVVRREHPQVKTGALSNCHGDWYEWLLSMLATNFVIQNEVPFLLLQLPNISQFDVAKLYEPKLYEYIKDLRLKVAENSDVSLITSNPDFVIINTTNLDLTEFGLSPINNFNPDLIKQLEDRYKFFIEKCSFDDIVGYLSVKTSLRPDRRLQISHEGSLMKALYVHLQTRDWILEPKGLKYFAASTKVSDADRKGLKTVATHSITNVQNEPEAAVDEVFEVDCNAGANNMFEHLFST